MRKIILSISLALIAFGFNANAQVVITSVGTPYTQNFDGLSNDTVFATPHALTLTGWSIFEKGTSSAVDQQYKVNNGSRNNGETYSYGDSTATDRALGSIASGTNSPAFGVVFQNNTGSNITDLNITYKGEQWRSGDTSTTLIDSLVFEYSTTATGINDTAATWNSIASLMFNSPNLVATTAGALNGNASPNIATISGNISVLIPNSGKILLRWRDINKAGSDDGLAIDDLTINFSAAGNPKPSITATTPVDNATLVSPTVSNLTMTFDQTVVVGTGNIILKNLTDVSQQTITCGTTTISGNTVTIPGVILVSGKHYAVNFDSTCYQSSTSANSYGIYDNTSWDFETQPNGLINFNTNNLTLQMLGNNTIAFNVKNSDQFTLSIYNIAGKKIGQELISAVSGDNKIILNTQSFMSGIYFIKVSNSNYTGSLKFEKQ